MPAWQTGAHVRGRDPPPPLQRFQLRRRQYSLPDQGEKNILSCVSWNHTECHRGMSFSISSLGVATGGRGGFSVGGYHSWGGRAFICEGGCRYSPLASLPPTQRAPLTAPPKSYLN